VELLLDVEQLVLDLQCRVALPMENEHVLGVEVEGQLAANTTRTSCGS
jgi:hypothetical protein